MPKLKTYAGRTDGGCLRLDWDAWTGAQAERAYTESRECNGALSLHWTLLTMKITRHAHQHSLLPCLRAQQPRRDRQRARARAQAPPASAP